MHRLKCRKEYSYFLIWAPFRARHTHPKEKKKNWNSIRHYPSPEYWPELKKKTDLFICSKLFLLRFLLKEPLLAEAFRAGLEWRSWCPVVCAVHRLNAFLAHHVEQSPVLQTGHVLLQHWNSCMLLKDAIILFRCVCVFSKSTTCAKPEEIAKHTFLISYLTLWFWSQYKQLHIL